MEDRFTAMEGFFDHFTKNKMRITPSNNYPNFSNLKELLHAAIDSNQSFYLATYKNKYKINVSTEDLDPITAEKYIAKVIHIAPQVHKDLCQKLADAYPNQDVSPSSIKLMSIHYARFSNGTETAELSFDDGGQFHGHIITTEIGPSMMASTGKYIGSADKITYGMQG